MTTLENEHLKVIVSAEGAELQSIFDKKRGRECLWQGDPQFWARRAPNLFPVVGACMNDQLVVDGVAYPMPKHGFARDKHFTRLETTPSHAKYSLHYTPETYAIYPYKFEFQVLYDLIDNALRVSYKVINLDKYDIWFAIGAHPAFNVPFTGGGDYNAYYLEFEVEEPLHTRTLTPTGYFSGEERHVPADGNRLQLTRDLFDNDALVFKNLKSRAVTLKSDTEEGGITVSFPHFDYLGIWAKPGADFVCLEPWLGCADSEGNAVEISQKEGIQRAGHGHVFETEMLITLN